MFVSVRVCETEKGFRLRTIINIIFNSSYRSLIRISYYDLLSLPRTRRSPAPLNFTRHIFMHLFIFPFILFYSFLFSPLEPSFISPPFIFLSLSLWKSDRWDSNVNNDYLFSHYTYYFFSSFFIIIISINAEN